IRLLRILWPGVDRGLGEPFEGDRQLGRALLPGPLELLAVVAQLPLEGSEDLLRFDLDVAVLDGDFADGKIADVLIGAVEGAGQGAVALGGDVQAEPQLNRADLEGALPETDESLLARFDRVLGTGRQGDQHKGEDGDGANATHQAPPLGGWHALSLRRA